MTKKLEIWPNRIRELRLKKGMTQQKLGELIGMSKQMVGRIELGRRSLKLEHQRAIARVLECSPADILPERDNPYALTDDERALIDHYRQADAIDRRLVRQTAEHVAERQPGFV